MFISNCLDKHLCIDSSSKSLNKFGSSLRLIPLKLISLTLPLFSHSEQVTDSIYTWECNSIINLHISKLLHWLQTLVYGTMNYERKNTILSKLAERFCELCHHLCELCHHHFGECFRVWLLAQYSVLQLSYSSFTCLVCFENLDEGMSKYCSLSLWKFDFSVT